MSTLRRKVFFALCLILSIGYIVNAVPVSAASNESIFPEGLLIEDSYRPGRGRPIGKVQRVQGDVIVMHAKILKGYRVARGTLLYANDTIMTLANSRVRFRMVDRSILSLAPVTKMVLNKSVYNKEKKRRSSFFNMALGKARVFVVKLLDFKRSEFKVKTPTAVCGVRGSEFILEVTLTETIATALEKTELEYISLAFPDEKPMVLTDFMSSTVKFGQLPSLPIKLSADTIEQKKGIFIDVKPEDDTPTDDQEDIQGEGDDDTGVDDVGELGDEVNLEDLRSDDLLGARGYDDILDDIEKYHNDDFDQIIQDVFDAPGELPDFPDMPQ